jgi:hypothetical protein
VLNGIGGCTIAEAKHNLSYDEALLWNAYIRKRGSLNTGRRIEISGAVLASLTSRVHGGKSTFYDFAHHEAEETSGSQIQQFAKAFGATAMTAKEYREKKNVTKLGRTNTRPSRKN